MLISARYLLRMFVALLKQAQIAYRSPDNRAMALQAAPFVVHTDVAKAQRDRRAVVALESTIVCHGMPYPQNLQTAQEVETVVLEGRFCPSGGAAAAPTCFLHHLELVRPGPHHAATLVITLPELGDRARQCHTA